MPGRARAPLRPGTRVGAFVVREEIGFGATSIVYEAEHRTVRHRVAIKVLRSLSGDDDELRQRFEREMKLCTTLASMHVPHVYEVGELSSGLPYIVMERLSGATLADWLAVHRKLPVAVVVEIGVQLCGALEALHERGVAHRDVKPENLVLHRAFSDGYVVKLVDFGICKPLNPEGPALTRPGTVVGTPEYMSPEQVQGADVDARTDVYSTGVLLYELLAGRTPFEGRDLDLLGRAILFASPPRLSSVREEVSAILEGIVMRAMARDRANRHPTIGALRRELERFAHEHGLRRHPHVWSFLPSQTSVTRPLVPPPPEGLVRRAHPTLITPRIPIRAGLFGWAAAGLAVLLGAGLSVAYYAYEPPRTDAEVRAAPEAEQVEPAPEPTKLELPAAPRTPVTAADPPAPEEEAAPPAPKRVTRRARRAAPAVTTVVFSSTEAEPEPRAPEPAAPRPTTSTEATPSGAAALDALEPQIAPVPIATPSISSAELFEQVSQTAPTTDPPAPVVSPPAPSPPVATSPIPPSPYERARVLPDNPF